MKISVIRATIAATMLAGAAMITGAAAQTTDDGEAKASPHCENVGITVKNASGQAIKLISIDYATSKTWKRGRIIFKSIDAGGSFPWSGSFQDLAGQAVRFRVNTRYVIDAQTDRYSDLKSTVISTAACASEEQHGVTIGTP